VQNIMSGLRNSKLYRWIVPTYFALASLGFGILLGFILFRVFL